MGRVWDEFGRGTFSEPSSTGCCRGCEARKIILIFLSQDFSSSWSFFLIPSDYETIRYNTIGCWFEGKGSDPKWRNSLSTIDFSVDFNLQTRIWVPNMAGHQYSGVRNSRTTPKSDTREEMVVAQNRNVNRIRLKCKIHIISYEELKFP
jgi:hypothetical protein